MLVLLKHEVNTRSFSRWPIISLVTLIHGNSYLISFEIVVGYWKLRSFQETEVNLNGLLEKPDSVMVALRFRNGSVG